MKEDGTRVPSAERQAETIFQRQSTELRLSPSERVELFSRIVEPTLERELKHKSGVQDDSSYSAELIGFIEVVRTHS